MQDFGHGIRKKKIMKVNALFGMDWEALTGVKMDKVSIRDDFFFNFPHVFCLQRLAKVFVIRIIKIRMPVVEL